MKRWTFRIVLMLLLGVVMTVGVAWGLACSIKLRVYTQDLSFRGFARGDLPAGQVWTLVANGDGAASVAWSCVEEGSDADLFTEVGYLLEEGGPRLEVESWMNSAICSPAAQSSPASGFAVAFGWPRLSLCAVFCDPNYDPESSLAGSYEVVGLSAIEFGPPPAWGTEPPRALPLRPILPGFLIDTLFYAVIWFGLFFGPGAARGVLRRKRGCCVKCGYDLRGSPDAGCPECGRGREDGTTNDALRTTNDE